MYITELELKNFRNYENLKVDFDEKINLILGNNAQGKTNLIESIYMSSIGRSFRTSRDSDLIMFGKDEAFIRVKAEKEYADTEVEIRIKGASGKSIKKDGVQLKKTSQLLENIMTVIFSPEDMKIVKDEPEKRRKFIDRELCQISPRYYDSLSNYRRTLIQRNSYLKEEYIDNNILDLWDVQLAKHGADIILMRKAFVEKISDFSSKIHSGITGGESLKVAYDPDIEIIGDGETQEKYYYDRIKKAYSLDVKNRSTSRGPHKDNIVFFVNDIDMRSFGSQGQQRTCALSLKLAELEIIKEETGEDAVLLLDDVMSELDSRRQKYLIKTLKNNQLFVTTTEIEERILGELEGAKIFNIYKGNFK